MERGTRWGLSGRQGRASEKRGRGSPLVRARDEESGVGKGVVRVVCAPGMWGQRVRVRELFV